MRRQSDRFYMISKAKKLPDFFFEKKAWKRGFKIVGGVDEVGRGALAGPVVAGCVAFRQSQVSKFEVLNKIKIDDSKKLTPRQRERASFWIKRNAVCYGIGWASVAQINKFGIKKASEIAFRMAIKRCRMRVDFLLIDAFFVPYVRGLRRKNQLPIVNGDAKSISIAASSIIAKVYRDKLMSALGGKYGWAKNKGYGTKEHQKAIRKYGPTRLHRKLFVRTFVFSQAR